MSPQAEEERTMMNASTPFQAPPLRCLPQDLDVASALAEGQFVPYFQPLVTLRTGKLEGFEVLARWLHPTKGTIPPTTFIAVAEQGGWIGELTRQILVKAFAAAAANLPDPLTLAINISPVQLRDDTLPGIIRSLATEAGFPVSRIVIEITESAVIDNPQNAVATVAELKYMGCLLALDDFGTGYSSLSHLQALPFDKLKVDRSFVSSITENRESRKIVSAVVGLGQSLGLTTVAEGIETQEQAEMLLWLRCDLGQGYFFGMPIPAAELPACVATHRERLKVHQGSAWKNISAADSPAQRLAELQAVYDGAPVGLAFLDQNLRYVNLNQKLADMNGATIEDHLGSSVAEMVPDLFPHVEPYIRRALQGEAVPDVEAPLPSKGETRLVSYHPVRDEADEVIGVSIAVADITARKRAEEALQRSEAHYRSMVDLNPQVLWIMDPQGRNLDVSPRWDKKTGLMKPQATEHEWLKSVYPEDIRPTVRSIAKSRRSGSAIDVLYRVSDGVNLRWKRSRGAPRFDANGKIVCWYGSVEDIVIAPEAQSGVQFMAAPPQ
jgi:PAS domain S-box-containing protein